MMEKINKYEIRCDILCDYYHADSPKNYTGYGRFLMSLLQEKLQEFQKENGKETKFDSHKALNEITKNEKNLSRHVLARFLDSKGKFKSLTILYENFLSRNTYLQAIDISPPLDTAKQIEIKKQILQGIDISDDQRRTYSYFFIDEYTIGNPTRGVILNDEILIDRSTDYIYFLFFFSFVFSFVDSPVNFLNYHLHRNFKNDIFEYKLFLKDCLKEKLHGRRPLLKEWIKQNTVVPSGTNNEQSEILLNNLEDVFVQSSNWPEIFNFLKNEKVNLLEGSINLPVLTKRTNNKKDLNYVIKHLYDNLYFIKFPKYPEKQIAEHFSRFIGCYKISSRTLQNISTYQPSFASALKGKFPRSSNS